MIENTQPARLYFGNIITSYTGALMQHSPSYDGDVVGRSFWLTKNSITQDPIVVSGAGTTQQEINGLVPGTSYTIEGTYYDAMVSMAMLTSRIGVSVSIPTSLITKTLPTISNVTETFKDNYSEIGLRNSKILISIEGDAETFYVEYNSGSGWLSLPPSELSSIETDLPPNNYSFRVSGATPTGLGVRELSTASLYSEVVTIEGTVIQPNTPTNLIYSLGKIQDTFERYDLKLEWSWARGNGGNIREFLVKAIISEDGGSAPISSDPRWDTPLILTSVGSSTEIVLTGIPKGIKLFYRIEATGYDSTRGISDILTLTAGDDTVDSTYTKESGIEVNYAHILAYATDGVDRVQTFKVEASTGEVSIGKLDPTTGAPIRVDPNNGRVTVKGDVVTDTINAASFVMTQFSSSDRPSIRTAERSNYADGISGLYMGYNADTNNPAFQFDIGNISNYMRWDGNSLSVKGSINATSLTVGGTIPTEIDNSNAISAAAQDATEKADTAATTSLWGGVSGAGKPADNADATNYLDDRVANSLSENGVLTVTRPKGGSFSAGFGSIGVIKITLPQSWTNTMMMFTVEVYEYTTDKSFSLVLGGYNYSPTSSWRNTTANLFGSAASDNRVRFGHDGTNCAIYIGNTNSNWAYPQISVKNFQAGYSNYSASQWDSGWNVSIETSVGTISKDISDSLIDAASIKNQGQLATREDVDFSTMVSGVTKPANNATANQSDDITNTPRTPVINQPINNFNGIFNSSSATSFVLGLTGSPYIGVGVIVTQYDPDIITNSTSASWTGSAWDTAALMVNGNVLATGTVRGNSISSNTTVLAGSGSTIAGMNGLDDGSNTGPDGYRFWAGAQDPRDAPFSVTKEGEVRADRFLGQVSSAGAYQSSGGKRVNIYNTSEQTILSLTINRHREFEQRVSIGPVMFSITLQSSGNTGAFTNLDATVAFQLSNASPNSISLVYESTLYSSVAGITFNTYKSISPLPVDILEIDEGTGTATVSFSIYLLPNSGSTLNEPAAFSGNYKTTISNLVCNSWIADGYLTLTDY